MQGAHLVVMESGAFYQIPRRKKNALHLGAFQGGGWYSIFFGFTSSSKRFHWVNLLRKIVDMKISKHLVGGEWFTIHWSTKHMVAAGTMHQRRWLGEWVGSDWGDEVQIFWSFQKVWLARPILSFVGVRLINPMPPMFWTQRITPGRCEHLGGRYSGLQTLTTQASRILQARFGQIPKKIFLVASHVWGAQMHN